MMIAASTYLPSTTSSTIAASSIHGTGVQNLLKAERNGCIVVSGIALGPNFLSRMPASSLVRPLSETSLVMAVLLDELACVGRAAGLGSFGEGRLKERSDIVTHCLVAEYLPAARP